jgi:hypothetical protein
MRPSRDGTNQHQYQNDQQNGSQSHGLLLGELCAAGEALGRSIATERLQAPATLNEIDDNNHDGNDQENVNEPAQRVRGHHSEQPKNN